MVILVYSLVSMAALFWFNGSRSKSKDCCIHVHSELGPEFSSGALLLDEIKIPKLNDKTSEGSLAALDRGWEQKS